MSSRGTDPLHGRLLDRRYLIGSRIAQGGMATVYTATDTRLDRLVAVKVMHPGLGDDGEVAARFVREARSAARLNHPSVVAVFDQGTDDGTVFLVMEHVPGRTLRDVIRAEAPLSPRRALALLEQVLTALAAAHDAGIVHRDVKPENVLLAPDGRVKVADFGLARAVTAATAASGPLVGTAAYLAPELVLDAGADARSDVYAAGVLLYELLTGAKPHGGETPLQVAYRHVHVDVPPPSARVPSLPPYVDALVARATARDRDVRPTDARVLLHQVRRVRSAVDQGLTDDPDLTADLRPHRIAAGADERLGLGPSPHGLEVRAGVAAPYDWARDPAGWSAAAGTAAPRGGASNDWGECRNSSGSGHANDSGDANDWDDSADTVVVALRGTPGQAAPHRPATAGAVGHRPPAVGAPGLPRAHGVSAATGATAVSWGHPSTRPATSAPAATPPRRSRRALTVLLALVLLAALTAGGWYAAVGRYTSTPALVGLSQSEATNAADRSGLAVSVSGEDFSETVPAGAVLRTEPAGDERIERGGTVELVLSAGQERYDVPRLVGLDADTAADRLAGLELRAGELRQQWSERYDEGTVVRQATRPGTSVPPGTSVDLVLSKGPRPIDVPDLSGTPAATAAAELRGLGFRVEVVDRTYDDTVPAKAVLSQTPASGTGVRGDLVELVVSKGPPVVEVPDVVGAGVDDAREVLEDAGFVVEERKSVTYIGLGYVVAQDPAGGEGAPVGSTVVLSLV